MSWKKVKLGEVLKQYRVEHLVQDSVEYKQVTISKHNGICVRGYKNGKDIGRKRQFIIDLKQYPKTLMFVRQGVEDGSIGIAPMEVDECIATENMPMFSVEGIEIEYLKAILKSKLFRDKVEKIPTTGSAQKSIHERQLLEIEIPLPNKKEQYEIIKAVDRLETSNLNIDSELLHQKYLIKQLRQSFLREAMQGKLTKQNAKDGNAKDLLEKIKKEKAKLGKKAKSFPEIKEAEIPFDIPEIWVWCRLGELALHSEAGKSFLADEITAQENEWAVIKTSAITSGNFGEYENKRLPFQNQNLDKIKIEIGDLLFCRASGSKGLAGKSCLVELVPKAKLILSDKSIRYLFSQDISKKFINFYNSSMFGEEYYKSLGTKKSTTMNNITREQFNNLPIPLPPLPEQNRIVKKLEELMKLCDELQANIQVSKEQNEMLLQGALRDALRK